MLKLQHLTIFVLIMTERYIDRQNQLLYRFLRMHLRNNNKL